ncbi:MAG: tetratricopeptide repeat protein [Hyphomicrobiaceae bacterium]|nr:tetratricopeptide repeat protein [Hyphomicrobiaceae bacterium]
MFKAKQGALAQEQGRFDLAIRLYSEALEDQLLSNDYRGIFYTDRGVIYASLGYSKHALKDFNNAVKFFPEYAAAYNNRGVLLLSLNYIDESIKDFNRAAILVPDYVSALNNRAAALAAKGELVLAIADYTAAIKLSPHEVAPLAGRANVKITQRRPYAAMRDLNRALLSHPKFALGYRLRSQVHTHLNNYTQATNDINRAIAIAPMDPNSYLVRGLVYLQARKLNAAIKDFDKAIELRPKFSEAYLERGHANVLLENFEEAKRDLTRSLSLSRKSGKAFAYLALMYKKKGNPELGLQEINKAMRLNSTNATILWAKGEIEEAMFEFDAAASSFKQALDINPRLKSAQSGLIRIGIPFEDQNLTLTRQTFGPWRISHMHENYIAQHKDFPKLLVPLEMVSDGQPKILSWEKKDELKDIGILMFKAGQIGTRDEKIGIDYAALIDLRSQKVIDLVPQRIGSSYTKWIWQDHRVLIIAVDGINTEHSFISRTNFSPM